MSTFNARLCSANFIAIAAIPVLFFISMAVGYLGLIPLNVPIHALLVIGIILFVFLLFVPHNANYTICKMKSARALMEQELKSRLVTHTLKIDEEHRSVLNIDDFLNRFYGNVRNDNYVSVASSVFPMMGILGTFVAIALSMPNFSVSDTQSLDHEISILLSGVGSAFFASIYGILLSLIWTYFEKRGLSKIDRFFAEVQKKFTSHVWSKEELTRYHYMQQESKEDRFLGALKETFSIGFIQTINEQHLIHFKEMMNDTSKNFTQITDQIKEVASALTQTLTTMDTNKNALDAQKQIDTALVDFTLATRSFERTTKNFSAELSATLNDTFEKIDTEISSIVVKLANFATHVSLESKEVQESIKKYHQQIADAVKVK